MQCINDLLHLYVLSAMRYVYLFKRVEANSKTWLLLVMFKHYFLY